MHYPHEGPAALIFTIAMTLFVLLGSASLLPVAAACALGGLMFAPLVHRFAASPHPAFRLK